MPVYPAKIQFAAHSHCNCFDLMYIESPNKKNMRKFSVFFVSALFLFMNCTSPKPAYKTANGKKKLKYYNAIQFGQKERPKMNFK
jgi:hypothetical protein